MNRLQNWKDKFILGITGNMASGKSTVAKIFESLGAHRISADEIAHFFTSKDSTIKAELIQLFGIGIQNEDGSFDRKKISALVFNNPEKLEKLNSLVHPLIRKKTIEEFEKVKNKIIAWEAPLLFEAKGDLITNANLTVFMDYEKSLEKVKKRDKITEEEFKNRLSKQMDIKEKLERSDFIINNNSSLENLEDECKKIYTQILMLRINNG